MSLCKSGQIQNCCLPNALLTLEEFLQDYGSAETKKLGQALIRRELAHIPGDKVRALCQANLEKIAQGERDFRF